VTNELPLAPASERLRRKPGRLKKSPASPTVITAASGVGQRRRAVTQVAVVHEVVVPIPPRLLDLPSAAAYLGVSEWTVRDLEANGTLRRVSIALRGGRELRKLLFDREDLDRLVEASKR
jgi:hypothetical protein